MTLLTASSSIVTAEMFAPLVESLTSGVKVAIPAGLGVLALTMGVRFAIKTFRSIAK